jgi:hypothetical protein
VCFGFFFILTTLDFLLMNNFQFWGNPDLMYRYWIILALVVVVFGFGLSFMGYISGLSLEVCASLFSTVILLFAGGLLDQFYALFAFIQGQNYSFAIWSLGWKLWGYWDWWLQILWSLAFYGVIVIIWHRVLRKH